MSKKLKELLKKFKYLSEVPEAVEDASTKSISDKIYKEYSDKKSKNYKRAKEILTEVDRVQKNIFNLDEMAEQLFAFDMYREVEGIQEEYYMSFKTRVGNILEDYLSEYIETKFAEFE
jgi:galactokinase